MRDKTQAKYNPNWKRDKTREEWRQRRWKIKMFFIKILWEVLFEIRLAKPYSRMLCRLNLYSKYSLSGRCCYCGIVHGMHWKIEKPNYGGLKGLKNE